MRPQARERLRQLLVGLGFAVDDQRSGHHLARSAGFGDDGGGVRIGAGARHHDDEIGGRDLVDQVLGAAGEVAEPGLHRPALAASRRALELDRGEECRALPCALRQPLHHPLARRVERDHLDGARPRIGVVDPEPRRGGGGHARAFAGHRGPSKRRWQSRRCGAFLYGSSSAQKPACSRQREQVNMPRRIDLCSTDEIAPGNALKVESGDLTSRCSTSTATST